MKYGKQALKEFAGGFFVGGGGIIISELSRNWLIILLGFSPLSFKNFLKAGVLLGAMLCWLFDMIKTSYVITDYFEKNVKDNEDKEDNKDKE